MSHADVDNLIAEERLEAAATLAERYGDFATAAHCWEKSCAWSQAARARMHCGELERAFLLAVQAEDPSLNDALIRAAAADTERAKALAEMLETRRAHGLSGALFLAARDFARAAHVYMAGRCYREAGRAFVSLGQPIDAARAFEARLREDPTDAATLAEMGELLVAHGKTEAAVRYWQRLPSGPERARVLPSLARALGELGMITAQAELRAEMHELGIVDDTSDRPRSPAPTEERLLGRYVVVRTVSTTAHARVCECTDALTGGRVAVKLLSPHVDRDRDALLRFEREARIMSGRSHVGLVSLVDFSMDDCIMVLEWMDGGSLADVMKKTDLPPSRSAEVTRSVLSALEYAHQLGIVHRDIKPGNILFDGAGVARVADFGVAHMGDRSTTATAAVLGTMGYMSPEQRRGEPATTRSDLYSVGAVLCEMLTGRMPDIRGRMSRRPSEVHRGLTAAHDRIVESLLAEDPMARPAGAADARSLIATVAWVADVTRLEKAVDAAPESVRPNVRYRQDGDSFFDLWLERQVTLIDATPTVLEIARVLAVHDAPMLQEVYCVSGDGSAIVAEVLPPPRDWSRSPRPLEDWLNAALCEALVQAGATLPRSCPLATKGDRLVIPIAALVPTPAP